ncbi:hypothetical protein [Haloechinothrix halophila]|uniref:hypothetical protein n=1 Tax=Haloechinothrix halophila TaxID=1069073 RepID=UPI0004088E53|nr:hypothetical protein [Haloechinothrix halophila]
MVRANNAANRKAAATHERLNALRKRVVTVGHEVEQLLNEQGVSPEQLPTTLTVNAGAAAQEVAKHSRRARRRLVKNAKRTRKELLREATLATREARQVARELRHIGKAAASNVGAEFQTRAAEAQREVSKAAKRTRRKTRRVNHTYWPWLLGAGIAIAAGVAYLVRRRPTSAATLHDESDTGSATTGGDEADSAAPVTTGDTAKTDGQI